MKNEIKKRFIILVFLIFISIFIRPSLGVLNPAAVYCDSLGYEISVEKTADGEMGICKFPDGSSCEEWSFLKGKCGKEFSYCSKNGYELRTLFNNSMCSSIFSRDCSVCVLENGTEVEVTKLMNLNFSEGDCGNDICEFGESHKNCPNDCPSGSPDYYCDGLTDGKCDPDCQIQEDLDCHCGNDVCDYDENYKNCPEDCPSGLRDGYCDMVKDGICDPDCTVEEDPDCKEVDILILIIIVALIISGIAFFRKRPVKGWSSLYKKWRVRK